MADPRDFARMRYVIDNFDEADLLRGADGEPMRLNMHRDRNNDGAFAVSISARAGNNQYYVSTAVADTKSKTIWITSAYISRKADQQALDGRSPHGATPETSLAQSATHSISPSDSDSQLLQERDTDLLTPRELLAGAFEGIATTDDERTGLQAYKDLISRVESMELQLSELRADNSAECAKGKQADMALLNKNIKDINRLEIRIARADRRLLSLENAKPLRDLMRRERAAGRDKARDIYKYRDYRGKLTNRLDKSANRLRRWLLQPDAKNHVPEELRKTVSMVLQALDMGWTRRDGTEASSARSRNWQEAMRILSEKMSNACRGFQTPPKGI